MTARSVALRSLKQVARAADTVFPPRDGVVVLAYHCVGAGTDLELDLPLDAFRRQMEWLAASGRAVSIDRALRALAVPGNGAGPPVVVTFDDGTADFADHAAPVMDALGVPSTIYVATAFIEEGRRFAYGGVPLSWDALHDARTSGLVTVGSHTHEHTVMRRLDGAAAHEALARSQDLIAEHVGRPAEHFAYPKGVLASPDAEQVVRERFRSAALGRVGANRPGHTDRYRLRRTPIQASDSFDDFLHKVDGGFRLEGAVRESFNRIRYATSEH